MWFRPAGTRVSIIERKVQLANALKKLLLSCAVVGSLTVAAVAIWLWANARDMIYHTSQEMQAGTFNGPSINLSEPGVYEWTVDVGARKLPKHRASIVLRHFANLTVERCLKAGSCRLRIVVSCERVSPDGSIANALIDAAVLRPFDEASRLGHGPHEIYLGDCMSGGEGQLRVRVEVLIPDAVLGALDPSISVEPLSVR